MSIRYTGDERPDVRSIAALYIAAQLRRPVDDLDRIARTYAGSPLVLSAWDGPRLIGILRGWTDGAYDGYVCDLAVDPDYQRQGVGRELLHRCVSESAQVQWVLRASVIATDYYAHLGWTRIENGWVWTRESEAGRSRPRSG
jgi:ribosomal protein S18 acetylase RimI-like enzyme